MSERIQSFLLRNTRGLQHLVNEKLAKRPGFIGRVFKGLEMGKREYGQHSVFKVFRYVNYFYVMSLKQGALMKPIGSRFFGHGNGPLNYSGLYVYFVAIALVLTKCRFDRSRSSIAFNQQDGAQYWFERYNMMFPPSFLHQRVSAHYIEINNIFFNEMVKKYYFVRKEVLNERDEHSDEVKKTKYALNPNYVYEPFKRDTPAIN